MSRLLIWLAISCFVSSSFAISNTFSVINNFPSPISATITPKYGNAHNISKSGCNGGLNQVSVAPNQSCQFQFTDDGSLNPGHEGVIQLFDKSHQQSCSIQYYFHILPTSSHPKKINEITKHTLEFSHLSCSGDGFMKNNIDLVSPAIKASARTLSEQFFGAGNLSGSVYAMANADCDGSDNCMVVTPTATQVPIPQGSSLQQSLTIQNHLSDFEPLNKAQFLGTHNSMISPAYTKARRLLDLSYADPDNFISLTNQLNVGVRKIEFDILWHKDAVFLCHNHTDFLPQSISCDDNTPMFASVLELKKWLTAHPKEFVIVYLDINQDMGEHWKNIDADFAPLNDSIYTPAIAQASFRGLSDHTLPADQISKHDMLAQGKQLIVVATGDFQDLKNSNIVFLHANHSNANLLYERGMDVFDKSHLSCDGLQKYITGDKLFTEDPGHHNIWRFNGDRTIINYISGKGQSLDFISTFNLHKSLNCPVNIYSLNMLGFTCNKDNPEDCAYSGKANMDRPTDPRLMTFLWSWAYGYPLQSHNGMNTQAYISLDPDHITESRLKNDSRALSGQHYVLCHQPNKWYVKLAQNGKSPQSICGDPAKGQHFAIPTTSYQFNDALSAIATDGSVDRHYSVLVNYHYTDNRWVAGNK